MRRSFIALGALSASLSVMAGAFGAHMLAGKIEERFLEAFRTGSHYHLAHSLSLVLIGTLSGRLAKARMATAAGWAHLAGIILFSGSLYALALSGQTWLGAITPLGGLAFILGWLLLAGAARGSESEATRR